MHRWGIEVDASAGRQLSATQTGSFFSLVLAWALDPVEPVALCALLKHPLCALSLTPSTQRELAALLETKVLRTTRASRSLNDLIEITLLEKRERISWPSPETQQATADLIARLESASGDLLAAFANSLSLSALALHVTTAAEAIATPASGSSQLWAGEAGNSAAAFLEELIAHGDMFGAQTPKNAVRLFETLMEGRVVRPRGTHPRLAILGPLEARLLSFDHTIVGGLDEGVWPALPKADPFLSRQMRATLGLPSAEQRIGLQAHDFIQLAAAPSVMLTRAARRGNTPTVPSRWLWRLNTLAEGALGEAGAKAVLAAEPLAWARALQPRTRTYDNVAARPNPKPPVALRPMKFSATEIEKWVRDPYSIYANKVLGLSALGELGTPIGARDRGTAIHAALESLTKGPITHPSAIEGRLTVLLQEALEEAGYSGVALAGDMIRLKPAIAAFAAWERERRPLIAQTYIENRGEITLDTPHGKLTLSARADRIDRTKEGPVDVIDYKTGSPPSGKQVQTFLASQLPITGLIVANGGFESLGERATSALIYFRFGSSKPGATQAGWIGRATEELQKEPSPASLIQKAQEGLFSLLEKHSQESTPYLSKPRPQFANEYGDFDHLARRAEWAAIAEGEDDESEAGE
jgi:ATP-dependent helicase/nuclease subunit B